jgi:hypothetical protein
MQPIICHFCKKHFGTHDKRRKHISDFHDRVIIDDEEFYLSRYCYTRGQYYCLVSTPNKMYNWISIPTFS